MLLSVVFRFKDDNVTVEKDYVVILLFTHLETANTFKFTKEEQGKLIKYEDIACGQLLYQEELFRAFLISSVLRTVQDLAQPTSMRYGLDYLLHMGLD